MCDRSVAGTAPDATSKLSYTPTNIHPLVFFDGDGYRWLVFTPVQSVGLPQFKLLDCGISSRVGPLWSA